MSTNHFPAGSLFKFLAISDVANFRLWGGDDQVQNTSVELSTARGPGGPRCAVLALRPHAGHGLAEAGGGIERLGRVPITIRLGMLSFKQPGPPIKRVEHPSIPKATLPPENVWKVLS